MYATPDPVAATSAAPVEVRAPGRPRNPALLPVLCSLALEPIRSCQVTARAVVDGRTVVVGRGSAHLDGRPSAHKLAVPVELNDLGRTLVGTGGALTLDAVVHGVDARSFAVSHPHRLAGAV